VAKGEVCNPPQAGESAFRFMYTVYILRSKKDNKRYIGITSDLKERIFEHNNGLVRSTKSRRPLTLIHSELFKSKTEARSREKFFKSGHGREYLKEVLKI
jgi:putative endonuclease